MVDKLTLEEPLVFPDGGAVDVQTAVGAPDAAGRRSIAVHSRATGAPDGPWTRHATGSLSAAPPPAPPPAAPAPWPPPGAVPLPVDGLYDRLADRGFGYGPAFRGLRAAWRHGDTLLAEVETAADTAGFGLHPALLDAAFHAQLTDLAGAHAESGGASLPFAWSGVRSSAPGPPGCA
ncbi:SDR family NAD(P)-dependent oxidoreductase OS=Streptomyces alboniger OX=132473 GN=CP975_27340 PE=4 SV=1 [Streptomyces alboniger]